MSGVPPPLPETRTALTAARVRRMRVARDACWVVVAAAVGAAGLVLLDAAVEMPGWGRGLGLAIWVTSVGVLAWRLLWRRWEPEPTPAAPAQAARAELPSNLSAAMAAALSLVGCLLAGSLVPGAGEHLRRVALPWQRPAVAQYRIVVTSGEPVVRRGDPVTLSAYAVRADPAALTPDAAVLVLRHTPRAAEQRFPMTGDDSGAFHVTLAAVQSDFEYRIEVGNAASDWFTVTAMDPAEIADGSVIEVSPPQYAPATGKRVFSGFVPFGGFQYSTAELRLCFTRPLSTALLEWQPRNGGPRELPPLTLTADRLGTTASFRLNEDGTLRLITFTEEHGKSLRWETSVPVRVKLDEPPRFEKLTGVWIRAVRPGERLPIAVTAADDIAIGSAVLEYALEDAQPVPVPFPLAGAGTPKAHGQLNFDLTGKGRTGDAIRFRVRIADTRRLDNPDMKPQETVYPETGWMTVRIDATAAPLEQQDILGQRDAVRNTLNAALEEIRAAREQAVELDRVTRGPLTIDQTVRLRNTQDRIRGVTGKLRDAAGVAAFTPELHPLAATVREVAQAQLRHAVDALGKAVTENPAHRAAALATAISQLSAARDRIAELVGRNDRVARDRLDRAKLAALAAAQFGLADRAGRKVAFPPRSWPGSNWNCSVGCESWWPNPTRSAALPMPPGPPSSAAWCW